MIAKREELDFTLAEKRIILMDGEINEKMAAIVNFWLLSFNAESRENITLMINCSGGSIQFGLSIYDLIKLSAAPVTGLVFGSCESMAVTVLQACKKRLATPNADFYVHQVSCEHELTLGKNLRADIERKIEELIKLEKRMVDIFVQSSRLKKREIKKLMSDGEDRNKYFSSQEAKKMGLIDEIIDEYPLFE